MLRMEADSETQKTMITACEEKVMQSRWDKKVSREWKEHEATMAIKDKEEEQKKELAMALAKPAVDSQVGDCLYRVFVSSLD